MGQQILLPCALATAWETFEDNKLARSPQIDFSPLEYSIIAKLHSIILAIIILWFKEIHLQSIFHYILIWGRNSLIYEYMRDSGKIAKDQRIFMLSVWDLFQHPDPFPFISVSRWLKKSLVRKLSSFY